MRHPAPDTRQHILRAALKQFARQGYAGTSVQEIVDAARVAKPALYYYFKSKAGLYAALVDWAFEERYRLMQAAAARNRSLPGQLVDICAATFAFTRKHRELVRLAFVAAFAAPGEVPTEAQCVRKGMRNFEFLHDLIRQGALRGELNDAFATRELAMGFAGMMNLHVLTCLVNGPVRLDRRQAERIVELFLQGARPRRANA